MESARAGCLWLIFYIFFQVLASFAKCVCKCLKLVLHFLVSCFVHVLFQWLIWFSGSIWKLYCFPFLVLRATLSTSGFLTFSCWPHDLCCVGHFRKVFFGPYCSCWFGGCCWFFTLLVLFVCVLLFLFLFANDISVFCSFLVVFLMSILVVGVIFPLSCVKLDQNIQNTWIFYFVTNTQHIAKKTCRPTRQKSAQTEGETQHLDKRKSQTGRKKKNINAN